MGVEKKDKNFLLIYDSVQFFTAHFAAKGIPVYPTMKKSSFFLKVLRRVSYKLGILQEHWFGEWKQKMENVDIVIIFASNEPSPIRYIRNNFPHIRIILWYWNPVFKSISPKNLPDNHFERWSFDRSDCSEYSMRFNSTFYFDTITLPKSNLFYDIVFVGVDKGRRKALDIIELEFKSLGLDSYFYIVDDDSRKRGYKGDFGPIPYTRYLSLVAESRAILDYVQPGQDGMTLRPMEALFFKKKLITNDPGIEKEDFYHPSNIFILGKDDVNDLNEFLRRKNSPINPEIRSKYDVLGWLDRFQKRVS